MDDYKKFFLTYPSTTEGNGTTTMTSTESSTEQQKRLETLLRIAHETRNFEIGLYWKRASYYWVFVSVIFIGYYTTLSGASTNSSMQAPNSSMQALFSILFPALGLIFTLGWCLANKGSKYWQENWEEHVNILEIIAGIPIHSVTKTSAKPCPFSLKPFPYSVSKINQLLSLVILAFWGIIYLYSLCVVFPRYPNLSKQQFMIIMIVVLSMVFAYLLLSTTNSSVAKENTEHDNSDPFNFNIGNLAQNYLATFTQEDKNKSQNMQPNSPRSIFSLISINIHR
ncbi:RipA family octameric membrane protein [Arcanobacterium phocae]|uniref:RipA family octameric membrane protein n=1 Tax=Arcanobacterium phocae TaxID=131112 RepID=UPI001C0E9673|nr:hypothetical protein [Arcanobacterium phocae]